MIPTAFISVRPQSPYAFSFMMNCMFMSVYLSSKVDNVKTFGKDLIFITET